MMMEVPIRCPLDEEFGYRARRELALCLDPIAPMGNDWRLLMDEMGFPYSYKHYLEQEKSPTIKLLEMWTQLVGGKATISLLKENISKLDPQRRDAVDVVQKYMKISEAKNIQNPNYNDDTFSLSVLPSDVTSQFANHCSLRTANHPTHNSTSSIASISSSVSSNREEITVSISPVSSVIPEAPLNSSTLSVISGSPSNGCETAQEPSSYIYPPSPTSYTRRTYMYNSYATNPSSFQTPDTLLNDHHTPVNSISTGEKLVLRSVENGSEPLGIDVSPSSSPKYRFAKNLSPSPKRVHSRSSSSSSNTLKQFDPVEETMMFQHDSSEDDCVVTTYAEEDIPNYDIYLSASLDDDDQKFAEMMYQKLIKQKFTVFFSGHHNIIGRPLADDVVQMIKDKCTKTLIILSESYNKDEKCTYEARMAHMKSLDARNHVLVPVMFKKCKAPDFISHLYYLDYERYKNRPAQDIQEYFWDRLYRSLRYNPQSDSTKSSSNKKKQSAYSKKLTTVITSRPKFPFFTR